MKKFLFDIARIDRRDLASKTPDEILGEIFKYLQTPEDLWNVAQVCKKWNYISSKDGNYAIFLKINFI
jgi:hypothetical protein